MNFVAALVYCTIRSCCRLRRPLILIIVVIISSMQILLRSLAIVLLLLGLLLCLSVLLIEAFKFVLNHVRYHLVVLVASDIFTTQLLLSRLYIISIHWCISSVLVSRTELDAAFTWVHGSSLK